MYESERARIITDNVYGKQLQYLFNRTAFLEREYGDLSDWTTQQYAEYAAKSRTLSYKAISTYKAIIKFYIKSLNKDDTEISDLDISKVYLEIKRLGLPIFWYDARSLAITVRNTLENGDMRSFGNFARDTIVAASLLVFCGLDFEQALQIKRDDVCRNGIWSFNLPTKLVRNTLESKAIMDYARSSVDGSDEIYPNLPLLRGGKSGREPLKKNIFQYRLTVTNNFNTHQVPAHYDVTASNITLSGEFSRLYSEIGNAVVSQEALEKIRARDYVRMGVRDLRWLYSLYCMLKS